MEIRLGTNNDLNEIVALYQVVVDDLEKNINYPGWKKGIYPTDNEAIRGIENEELYVVCHEDKIIGSMVVNHVQEKNYQQASWSINANADEVYVIHTLAINPEYKGLKIAQKLLEFTDELAKNNGVKTIRLDVRKGNIPAVKLYLRCGYTYVGAINLDFRGADLGLFELYEKII